MIKPYYADDTVQLFHSDCLDLLPSLRLAFDSVVTDPPYGETSASWDRWPAGWVGALERAAPRKTSFWCFGSARMFLTHRDEFTNWKFAQELLWVKRNGTGPTPRDRLVKLHEWAYHWYRGPWGALHHEWEREAANDLKGSARRINGKPAHQGKHSSSEWVDDHTRQPRSVTYVVESPSVRFQRRHQDEKPVAVVAPLVRECTPAGGVVLDPFAGTGTTAVAARMTGRRAVLIEANEAMCEIAASRLAQDVLEVMP